MSASLVGSEMCIRDRRRCVRCAVRTWKDRARVPWSHHARRTPRWRGSVSYTHLTLPTICSV
eukprot:10155237-Alexandrium_andersonii.AAC.1